MALNYSYGILGTFLVPQSPNLKKKKKVSKVHMKALSTSL